jgi:hypothetical protein
MTVKQKCDVLLDNATICLTPDGWSNIRNDPTVNYMATSSSQCRPKSRATTQIGFPPTFVA